MHNAGRLFLTRLLRDPTANVLGLAAAAIIPLLLIVGGTIDLSRFYMVNTRIQNACDSGALAARKAMGDNDFSEAERSQGLAFFDHNFPDGSFGVSELQRNYVADADGIVTGTASATLPTTIMSFFGHGDFNVQVTCSAEINISNTDVLFVLDVTGSMNCPDDGSYCPSGNNNNVEATNSKIDGLRDAVISFYDTVDDATSPAAQVRYGFVPYSSGINVGRAIPAEHMATTALYQTRVPQYVSSGETELVSFTINSVSNRGNRFNEDYWFNPNGHTVSNRSACEALAASSDLGYEDVYVDGSLQNNSIDIVSETIEGNIRTQVITARGKFREAVPVAWWGNWYGNNCFVDLERAEYWADFEATIVEEIDGAQEFDEWLYTQASWNVAGLYSENGSIVLPTGNDGANQTHTWDGCIEEAATTQDSSFWPLPAAAYDLNINLIPANEAQRWKPTLPNAVYERRSGGNRTTSDVRTSSNNSMSRPAYFCPPAAIRLGEMERQDVVDYLDEDEGFVAIGSTYHDIGMIWGARFITPSGLFAADNASAPNGDSISRHIVFMTDGLLSTSQETYTPYGMHWWDRRVTSSTNQSTVQSRHAARFQSACRQARAENISVWVVAFGTELSQNLIDCATPGRAYHAEDSDALEEAFDEIAEKIASLRLTA